MGQHAHIALDPLPYTRWDYVALRAYCLKLPFSVIERYYSEDSPQRALLQSFSQGVKRVATYLFRLQQT
jgi:hypothetical protein